MRLWHQALIPYLPDKQLGGQWCEIRMILGSIAKHGKVNHSTVNYVNNHRLDYLYAYGLLVANECIKRGRYCNPKFVEQYSSCSLISEISLKTGISIYPEHNDEYLEECLENLYVKGIIIFNRNEFMSKGKEH